MLDDLPDAAETGGAVPSRWSPTPPPRRLRSTTWAAERTAALDGPSRPTTVAATALTDEGDARRRARTEPDRPGLQKRPRDLDLPPWLKGRYGTAVGRAVHGVLQTIDLATGAGLDAAAGRPVRGRGRARTRR